MGYGRGLLRAILGVALFLGIIWFVYVAVIVDHTRTRVTRRIALSTGTSKHLEFFAKRRYHIHQDVQIHSVSRRRVPTGPDPIHNRGVPKDRQPPGRY